MDETATGEKPKPTRLAVHIPPAIDLRLRLQKLATGRQMGEIVAEVLDSALPSAEDLAAQIPGRTHDR